MGWKAFLSFVLVFLFVALVASYLFLPFLGNNFFVRVGNSSQPSYNTSDTQFYRNLRFPDKVISYNIDSACSPDKANQMVDAFNIIQNLTVLKFYSVDSGEQIGVTCRQYVRDKAENGFFVAGEGGPVNITLTENYGVIEKGKILLIRDSTCSEPDIAIHELLHALGFKHSNNPDSIMYAVSSCSQVITDDIPKEIDRLYQDLPLPDLVLENFSAQAQGRYLDVAFTVINQGLVSADNSTAVLFVNSQEVKRIDLQSFDVGYGTNIELKNIFIPFGTINTIGMEVQAPFNELNKKNNKLEVNVKS